MTRARSSAVYRHPAARAREWRSAPDLPFWLDVVGEYHPRTVLELGVGTGRVSLALAQAFPNIEELVGVDNAPEMLGYAQEMLEREPLQVRGRVSLALGDITNMTLGRRFDLVFAAMNTFAHLTADVDRRAAFAACYGHTTHGGRIIVDVANPATLERALPGRPSVHAPGHVMPALRAPQRRRPFFDPVEKMQSVMGDGLPNLGVQLSLAAVTLRRATAGVVETGALHQYTLQELLTLLEGAGYAMQYCYGGYDRLPIGPDSTRLIVAGERR